MHDPVLIYKSLQSSSRSGGSLKQDEKSVYVCVMQVDVKKPRWFHDNTIITMREGTEWINRSRVSFPGCVGSGTRKGSSPLTVESRSIYESVVYNFPCTESTECTSRASGSCRTCENCAAFGVQKKKFSHFRPEEIKRSILYRSLCAHPPVGRTRVCVCICGCCRAWRPVCLPLQRDDDLCG